MVSAQQIEQLWTVGSWESPGTIDVTVDDDDAILVLGLYWDAGDVSDTAPSINNGATLTEVLNQVEDITGNPNVGAQMHIASGLSSGTYTVTPPDLGGASGDGTCFVLHISNCGPAPTIASTGEFRDEDTAIPSVSVELDSNAQVGDLIVALGGYDNLVQFGTVTISEPSGWTSRGLQDDASWCVPCRVSSRVANASDTYEVEWSWDDDTANVVCALIAAIRYGE